MLFRRTLLLFVTIVLSMSHLFGLHAFAAVHPLNGPFLKLNNTYVLYHKAAMPFISKNRLMIPLQLIFGTMRRSERWEKTTQTLTSILEHAIVQVTSGSKKIVVGGRTVNIPNNAITLNGSMYVPARAFESLIQATVNYDQKTRTVQIISKRMFSADPFIKQFNKKLIISSPVTISSIKITNEIHVTSVSMQLQQTSTQTQEIKRILYVLPDKNHAFRSEKKLPTLRSTDNISIRKPPEIQTLFISYE